MAANRCSRRAAESRVAPAMKTSTGNSSAAATTPRIKVIPSPLVPTNGAQPGWQSAGPVVLISVTSWASAAASASASTPLMASRLSGDGRASRPISPTTVPG